VEGHKNIKVTVAIPVFNNEKTVEETLISIIAQDYPLKEILILDDGCTDKTIEICQKYPTRIIRNEKNMGIGLSLARLMNEAYGKYVVYMCADDLFTNSLVVSDIVKIFDEQPAIGVIDRTYYQFLNGYPGAVMECRYNNIFESACNPSGMAFRKMEVFGTNDIFIEMPSIVVQYLHKWRWTRMDYDTVAVRLHPGGNAGTRAEYYKGSQIRNWVSLIGEGFRFNQGFIQIKNRAPKMLWPEIKMALKLTPKVREEKEFWICVIIAVVVPGWILRPLSNFYRHRINRRRCRIIEREKR